MKFNFNIKGLFRMGTFLILLACIPYATTAQCDAYEGEAVTVTTTGGTSADANYVQYYLATEAGQGDSIVARSSDGTFTFATAGTYTIYGYNYEDTTAHKPSPGPVNAIYIHAVDTSKNEEVCADFSVTKTITVCAKATFCENELVDITITEANDTLPLDLVVVCDGKISAVIDQASTTDEWGDYIAAGSTCLVYSVSYDTTYANDPDLSVGNNFPADIGGDCVTFIAQEVTVQDAPSPRATDQASGDASNAPGTACAAPLDANTNQGTNPVVIDNSCSPSTGSLYNNTGALTGGTTGKLAPCANGEDFNDNPVWFAVAVDDLVEPFTVAIDSTIDSDGNATAVEAAIFGPFTAADCPVANPTSSTLVDCGSDAGGNVNLSADPACDGANVGDFYMVVVDTDGEDANLYVSGGDGGSLPVELVYFSGEQNGDVDVLSWATATEINTDYFIVETSIDGERYTQVGEAVKAAGTSTTEQKYTLTNVAPFLGVNYYRLKSVDVDGDYTYSQVITLQRETSGRFEIMTAVPNPTKGSVEILFTSTQEERLSYVVLDVVGRVVDNGRWDAVEGVNTMPLNLNNLANATYIISLQKANGERANYRIVKN